MSTSSNTRVPYNTERERRQLLAMNRLLDVHDESMRELNARIVDELPEEQEAAREALRSRTALALRDSMYQPEYSAREAMRSSVRELMQLADDVLVVNEEADNLSRTIGIEATEAVRAEWDGEDFGNLVTKLCKVRRALLIGSTLVGPELALDIARLEAERLFGLKPQTPRRPSVQQGTQVHVDVAERGRHRSSNDE